MVLDVGINRLPPGAGDKGELVGDIDYASAAATAGAIYLVPGGVGPMTIACLLRNTLAMPRTAAPASRPGGFYDAPTLLAGPMLASALGCAPQEADAHQRPLYPAARQRREIAFAQPSRKNNGRPFTKPRRRRGDVRAAAMYRGYETNAKDPAEAIARWQPHRCS